MLVIVGLGNKGKQYDNTYHNLGFMALDHFANSHGLAFTKSKYFAEVAEGMIGQNKVTLLKPSTFMNASGKSVGDIVRKLKLPLSNLLVVYDDIDLDFGAIRIRAKGSAGTHNGMRDIVNNLSSQDFARVRVGSGRPEGNMDLATFVLSKISKDKMDILDTTFSKTTKCIDMFIEKNGSVENINIGEL